MESCVTDTLYMTAKSGDAAYIGKNNWTLLQIACLFEKKELMLSLLRLGADPNIGASIWNGVDSSYYSFGNMLAWIITMSYLEGDKLLLIEEVVKYGADPNRAVQSDSILYAACVIPSNSEEVVLKLIEAGADTTKPFFNEDIGKRFSSLHLPFELGYQRVVRKICESGVDPNEVYDTWPLLCSVNFFSAKMLETSRILIEYGVDVNGAIPSKPGEEERCAGMTPLMKCCYDLQYSAMAREGGKEIWVENVKQFCRLLLEKGANVDAVTPYGETALMFLCGGMVKDNKIDPVNVNLARMLLDYGANPGVKCKDGKTAVEYIRNTTSDIAKHKELKPELKQEILNILPELMQK